MGFRFFRRVKIIPGVTLNISKSGPSISVGPKGAKLTLGQKGIRRTLGIPGTGIYYTDQMKYGKNTNPNNPQQTSYSLPGGQPQVPQGAKFSYGYILAGGIFLLAVLYLVFR